MAETAPVVAAGADKRAESPPCPVCRARDTRHFLKCAGEDAIYWRCRRCHATFLDAAAHPAREQELAHYLTHENHVDDPGYRAFLSRLASPLLERLGPRPLSGLDYGCGPGPALARMLRDAGHTVALYDPFFGPDGAALAATYDFITCTETAEHFHRPAAEFDRLDRLLRRGGWLGLMTSFQTDDGAFERWHYRRDPTHVVFYKRETLEVLAGDKGWSFESPAKNVALMRKPQ
jgi:SAM-dependent methyltransferase